MKKNIRILSVTFLSLLMAVFAFFGCMLMTVRAEAPNADSFYAENGASIRFANAGAHSGLRFRIRLGDNVYGKIEAGNALLGVLIIPKSYNDEYVAAKDTFTGDIKAWLDANKDGKAVDLTLADKEQQLEWIKEDADGHYADAAITDVKFNNVATDFVAIAYLDENGTKTYADASEGRSIKTVAAAALADTEAEYTTEQETYLNLVGTYATYLELGVTQEADGRFNFQGQHYGELSDIDMATTYKVEHYKKVDGEYVIDGEPETKNANTFETVKVTQDMIKNYDGYCVNMTAQDAVMEAQVAYNGSTTLKIYYDPALTAGEENKAHLAVIDGGKITTQYITPYTGEAINGKSEGVYEFNPNGSQKLMYVVGIDKDYVTENNYTKISFSFRYKDTTNYSNTVFNSDAGGASAHLGGDMYNRHDAYRLYSSGNQFMRSIRTYSGTAVWEDWIKAEIKLDKVSDWDGDYIALNFTMRCECTVYLADFKLETEEFDKPFSPIEISLPNGKTASLININNSGVSGLATSKIETGTFFEKNAAKITDTGVNAAERFMRIMGVTAAELAEQNVTELRFKVYWDSENGKNANPTIFGYGGSIQQNSQFGVSINDSGNITGSNGKVTVYKEDGETPAEGGIAHEGEWNTVVVKIAGIADHTATPESAGVYPVFNFLLRVGSGTVNDADFVMYLADMEFVAAE